jgi:hypothetical protein
MSIASERSTAVSTASKVEEKGSDVNLASHLLLDAFQNSFDVGAVLSNDSDLVEPCGS